MLIQTISFSLFRSTADEYEWKSNAHLMELYYIFGAPFIGYDMVYGEVKTYSVADKEMNLVMMDIWGQFAKFNSVFSVP